MDDLATSGIAAQASPVTSASGALDLIERLSRVVALASAVTVVASVFYDWAYFGVGAPSAMQLLTIGDHVSGALQWLPLTALTYALNITFYSLSPRASAPKTTPKTSARKTSWAARNFWRMVLAFILALSLVAYLFSALAVWSPVLGLGLVAWIIFVYRAGLQKGMRDHLTTSLLLGGLIVLVSLERGNDAGVTAFGTTKADTELVTRDGTQIDQAVVIRQMEKGVLVRNVVTNRLTFAPWD